jgi:hypothetical protein
VVTIERNRYCGEKLIPSAIRFRSIVRQQGESVSTAFGSLATARCQKSNWLRPVLFASAPMVMAVAIVAPRQALGVELENCDTLKQADRRMECLLRDIESINQDLKNMVRYDDGVQLQSNSAKKDCIERRSGAGGTDASKDVSVASCTPATAQRWKVRR